MGWRQEPEIGIVFEAAEKEHQGLQSGKPLLKNQDNLKNQWRGHDNQENTKEMKGGNQRRVDVCINRQGNKGAHPTRISGDIGCGQIQGIIFCQNNSNHYPTEKKYNGRDNHWHQKSSQFFKHAGAVGQRNQNPQEYLAEKTKQLRGCPADADKIFKNHYCNDGSQ